MCLHLLRCIHSAACFEVLTFVGFWGTTIQEVSTDRVFLQLLYFLFKSLDLIIFLNDIIFLILKFSVKFKLARLARWIVNYNATGFFCRLTEKTVVSIRRNMILYGAVQLSRRLYTLFLALNPGFRSKKNNNIHFLFILW